MLRCVEPMDISQNIPTEVPGPCLPIDAWLAGIKGSGTVLSVPLRGSEYNSCVGWGKCGADRAAAAANGSIMAAFARIRAVASGMHGRSGVVGHPSETV